ncbi:MAG TPA: FecR domain-containing protein [Pseudosphingobacterium sp.]|nr:FecR domain-containing protein [Pseudosphingobacterium sp.]
MERKGQDINKDLLKRYLEGGLSADEKRQVDRWYESLHQAPSGAFPSVTDAIRKKTLTLVFPKRSPKIIFMTSAAAAAVLLLFVVYGLFQGTAKKTTVKRDHVVQTAKGERKKITLLDGSTVWLNAESSLRFAPGFGKKHRKLNLVGEAYFEVSPKRDCPFILYAGGIKTRVLGTSFNVKAYPNYRQIKVAVSSGKVQVADLTAAGQENQRFLLAKGQAISYSLAQGKATLHVEQPSDQNLWLSNKLFIDHYDLQEIALELSRYYRMPVKTRGSTTKSDHYTIALGQIALPEALKILSSLTKVNMYEKDGTIWMTLQ